jgi:serine/threonine-protein kinase 24/25/MST4
VNEDAEFVCSLLEANLHLRQIDLESSEDDIQEIQQEISLLSSCASPFVTQYKASFLRGTKLWIVMEYLGGGSCLDLVSPFPAG